MKAKLIHFLIAESPRQKKGAGETVKMPSAKSAPHYFETSVPKQSVISREKISVGGLTGTLFLKIKTEKTLSSRAKNTRSTPCRIIRATRNNFWPSAASSPLC